MARIHLLEDQIINKIAAGEVVERPASVVKELVENAIDAGATAIHIELEEGGRRRITVRDNGSGMERDDAFLAVKRHATSKIAAVDDLYAIESMGFRGEALASIASVSRLSLATRTAESELGHKISWTGGEAAQEVPWTGAVGTSITVEELFFNVPARAKFLKSAVNEFAFCAELVQALALARPRLAFSLTHNGKEKLRMAALPAELAGETEEGRLGEALLRHRATELWGRELAKALLYVCDGNQFGWFEGLVSPPGVEKATAKNMLCFVNGRWVKDKVLRFGILRGYQTHLLKGRFPQVLGHFSTDPALIDVNVHPAKTELRFQYGAEVQGVLAVAIRKALREGAWAGHSPAGSAVTQSAACTSELRAQRPVEQGWEREEGGGRASAKPPTSSSRLLSPFGQHGGSEQDAGLRCSGPAGSFPAADRTAMRPHGETSGFSEAGAPANERRAGMATTEQDMPSRTEQAMPSAAERRSSMERGQEMPARSDQAILPEPEVYTRVAPGHELSGRVDQAALPYAEQPSGMAIGREMPGRQEQAELPAGERRSGMPSGQELAEGSPPPRLEEGSARNLRLGEVEAGPRERQGAFVTRDGGKAPTVIPWQDLHWRGSLWNCYVFLESSTHVLLVDQHAFHERILFERLRADRRLLGESQALVIPEVLELSASELAVLAEHREPLGAMGFRFTLCGDATLEVQAVPSLLIGKDLERLFAELAEQARGGSPAELQVGDEVLATLACHSAVRAGEALGEDEWRLLLAEARRVDFYHNCPHGRRVFRWFRRDEVARWFDRV